LLLSIVTKVNISTLDELVVAEYGLVNGNANVVLYDKLPNPTDGW